MTSLNDVFPSTPGVPAGTHEELMALPDGGYSKLVVAQGGAKAHTPKAAATAAALKAA